MIDSSTNIGPFSSPGIFTSHDPLSALPLAGSVKWVAVTPNNTPETVNKLKDAGFDIVVWQDAASPAGLDAVKNFGASGYIAQAEGPGQLEAATRLTDQITVPKALVTNLFWAGQNQAWPSGWIAMPEAYQNANAPSTPGAVVDAAKNMGATTVIPVVGTYDAKSETPAGTKIPMSQYLNEMKAHGINNFGAFSSEYLNNDDINAIKSTTSYQQTASYSHEPAATPSESPAWHLNPNWHSPTPEDEKLAGLNPANVLEERPGENGNTIFRMSDGTYKTYNPTRPATELTQDAGTWNSKQWDGSSYSPANAPGEQQTVNSQRLPDGSAVTMGPPVDLPNSHSTPAQTFSSPAAQPSLPDVMDQSPAHISGAMVDESNSYTAPVAASQPSQDTSDALSRYTSNVTLPPVDAQSQAATAGIDAISPAAAAPPQNPPDARPAHGTYAE
jgi:hypothetical protein